VIKTTPFEGSLTPGDVVTFEGVRRWPLLVRIAAFVCRIELPVRPGATNQFVVTSTSDSVETFARHPDLYVWRQM
jgi:hypothetical protein